MIEPLGVRAVLKIQRIAGMHMVGHQVHQHPHTPPVGGSHKGIDRRLVAEMLFEAPGMFGPVPVISLIHALAVVARIFPLRIVVQRGYPQHVDTQGFEIAVFDRSGNPGKIAAAVMGYALFAGRACIAPAKAVDHHLIDNRVPPVEGGFFHPELKALILRHGPPAVSLPEMVRVCLPVGISLPSMNR